LARLIIVSAYAQIYRGCSKVDISWMEWVVEGFDVVKLSLIILIGCFAN